MTAAPYRNRFLRPMFMLIMLILDGSTDRRFAQYFALAFSTQKESCAVPGRISPTYLLADPTRKYGSSQCSLLQYCRERRITTLMAKEMSDEMSDEMAPNKTVWSPTLRKIMTTIAAVGVIETGYLTYLKLFTEGGHPAFCGATMDGYTTCQSVLTGPYSNIPYTNVPLAALGFLSYLLATYLSISPLLLPSSSNDNSAAVSDDTENRILLTSLTTAMGTFSIFLMSLLFGILHQNCPYCVFSAACSITLAQLAWIGGCLPETSQMSIKEAKDSLTTKASSRIKNGPAVASAFLAAITGAIILFASTNFSSDMDSWTGPNKRLLASTDTPVAIGEKINDEIVYTPPAITTKSSAQALKIAKQLNTLDAKMYGAFWCSHCYDQKQIMGKQAFETYIKYVECSKDGLNSQTKFCKAMKVEGFPTWQIQGKLYPGQMDLDELEEIVNQGTNPATSSEQ